MAPALRRLLAYAFLCAGAGALMAQVATGAHDRSTPPGMVRIPGGEFTMGATILAPTPTSGPRTGYAWQLLDGCDRRHNAQFRRFVDATGYLTTAERRPSREDS